jgi:hypothetical protein
MFRRNPQRSFCPVEQSERMLGGILCAIQALRAVGQEIGEFNEERDVIGANVETTLGRFDCFRAFPE